MGIRRRCCHEFHQASGLRIAKGGNTATLVVSRALVPAGLCEVVARKRQYIGIQADDGLRVVNGGDMVSLDFNLLLASA